MREINIPDLTFSMVTYGKNETPWDLCVLLYKGGASASAHKVSAMISNAELGVPLLDRFSLVTKIHEVLAGRLASGESRHTAQSDIRILRAFFKWADDKGQSLNLDSVERTFVDWSDYLLHRQRVVGDLSGIAAYTYVRSVAGILDEVLELKVGLLEKVRIRKPPRSRDVLGTQADKQNLEQTFAFGRVLLDICDALTIEVINGPLPILIRFRTGQELTEWSGHRSPDTVKSLTDDPIDSRSRYNRTRSTKARSAWDTDTSVHCRYPIINLRIMAEMMIFIAQTGMNLAQAHKIKMGQFRYRSHLDGYQVHRVYKERRNGEVEFEIFSEYREVFERYIAWRHAIFPNDKDGLLFPLVRRMGRMVEVSPGFDLLRVRCRKLGVSFLSPSVLRKTRINWLLRLSRDPDMTAGMHFHTKETLLNSYEQPSLQVAMVEISRFHARTDPAISPPGPGVCVEAVPQSVLDAPVDAPIPDCASPSGCLFCEHQRDIDSEDHVWSLSSYRYFKSLEIASYRLPAKGSAPISAVATMDRVTAKLKYFKESSEVRALWVSEMLARIEEGEYHPRWDGFIQLLEARA